MIELIIFIILTLCFVIFGLHLIYEYYLLHSRSSKSPGYTKLVCKISDLSIRIRKMADLANHVEDTKVLDYYESSLRLFENILSLIHRLPNIAREPTSLRSAFYLTDECERRVERTHEAFRIAINRQGLRHNPLLNWRLKSEPAIKGCYFCSRPAGEVEFKLVKAKIEDITVKVMSCKVCADKLKMTNKVRVLHFLRNGFPLHWSRVKDYQPCEDYWNLNRPEKHPSRLELVYSRPSEKLE